MLDQSSFLKVGVAQSFYVDLHSDLSMGQQYIKANLGDADLDLLVTTNQRVICVPSVKSKKYAQCSTPSEYFRKDKVYDIIDPKNPTFTLYRPHFGHYFSNKKYSFGGDIVKENVLFNKFDEGHPDPKVNADSMVIF